MYINCLKKKKKKKNINLYKLIILNNIFNILNKHTCKLVQL